MKKIITLAIVGLTVGTFAIADDHGTAPAAGHGTEVKKEEHAKAPKKAKKKKAAEEAAHGEAAHEEKAAH